MSVASGIAHLCYFEALGNTDEASPEWQRLKGGLLALRLVDNMHERQRLLRVRLERWEIEAVAEQVDLIDEGHVARRVLRQIVSHVSEGVKSAVPLLPKLMAYARALEYEARWVLAADVYRTVVGYATESDQLDIRAPAACQLGYCLRMASDLDAAQSAYWEARQLALRCEDRVTFLQAELGQANIALQKGNLPEAECLLDDLIAAARAARSSDMLSRALHARAEVAGRRGQFEQSVLFAHQALERCTDPLRRDRILADIGNSLGLLGQHAAAQEAFQLLAATAQEQYLQWLASVNLLELAVTLGSEPRFEQYRRELSGAELPPMLAAYYQLYVGQGCRRFERRSGARESFEKAISLARQHNVNEVLLRAESALIELEQPSAASGNDVGASPALGEVIRAIRGMRIAVRIGIE